VERIAIALEGMLMVQHAPAASSAAFIRSRIAGEHGPGFGTLPSGVDTAAIVERARPT
jgi:putative acyl-CoA dehydrogenase